MMKNLSSRERIMVMAAAVVILLVIVWLGVVEPYRAGMARLDSQISARSASLEEMKLLQQEILRLRQQLAQAAGKKSMTGPLFSQVEALTEQTGVRGNLLSMRPQQASVQGEYRQQLVDLKLEKLSVAQLVRFLYAVEYSGHGMQVKSLRIKRRFDDHSSLDVTLSLFTLEQS